MFSKITHIQAEEFTFPPGVPDTPQNRHYNHIPEPFHIITWSEYEHALHCHSTTHLDRRMTTKAHQMEALGRKVWTTVEIRWTHAGGFARVRPNKWHLEDGRMVYDDEPMFLRIGCLHKNGKEKTHKMFDHTFECMDCDYSIRYDSSG